MLPKDDKKYYKLNRFCNKLASQHNRDKLYRDRKDYGWLGGSMAVNNPLTGRVAVKILLQTVHYFTFIMVCLNTGVRISLVE